MNLETLLSKFSGVRKTATGWQARCPAHEDRKASLSISVDGDKILMHDFTVFNFESELHFKIKHGEVMQDAKPRPSLKKLGSSRRIFSFLLP